MHLLSCFLVRSWVLIVIVYPALVANVLLHVLLLFLRRAANDGRRVVVRAVLCLSIFEAEVTDLNIHAFFRRISSLR